MMFVVDRATAGSIRARGAEEETARDNEKYSLYMISLEKV